MIVTNLESWAGMDFAYAAGEEVELPEMIAVARIEAGLAAPIKKVDRKITSKLFAEKE